MDTFRIVRSNLRKHAESFMEAYYFYDRANQINNDVPDMDTETNDSIMWLVSYSKTKLDRTALLLAGDIQDIVAESEHYQLSLLGASFVEKIGMQTYADAKNYLLSIMRDTQFFVPVRRYNEHGEKIGSDTRLVDEFLYQLNKIVNEGLNRDKLYKETQQIDKIKYGVLYD